MDYQRFIKQLPQQYENWGNNEIKPKLDKFQQILHQVPGMTTANILQLLNFAVECMAPDEVYCEIGCFRGSTLIGALLDHCDRIAYAVDNFSEFDPEGTGFEQLTNNLEKFNLTDQVYFFNENFEEFFCELSQLKTEDKIGVYFYDGAHDYRSQLMGLLLAKPFLADQALMIVDDSNLISVKQANWDFIATHPACRLVLNIGTLQREHPSFWNGIQVLCWDVNQTESCDWKTIKQHRESYLIERIYHHHFEVENTKPVLL